MVAQSRSGQSSGSSSQPEQEWLFPEKLGVLFKPARYKVLYGGRGGAKSWGAARALLAMASEKPLRILCGREYQTSIDESVHALLGDQIKQMGLAGFYDVKDRVIRGANGSEFSFSGLKHKIDGLKSTEGIDICWIEEAQVVSKTSWEKLIPTIRKEGSEIWISFNPELETDETYRRFVLDPPANAVVVMITYRDNPWFPSVLEAERLEMQAKDPDGYQTVWEGRTRQVLDGAIYAKELREAAASGRITRVPYSREKTVDTFWDLGRADNTSIWFAQVIGLGEYRVIDFYQANGFPLDHYLRMLQSRGYVYGTHHLPHDADHDLLASKRTITQQMRDAGIGHVHVLPRLGVADGINAARTIFPNCWFDEAKCADGLNSLRRYRYDLDKRGERKAQPLHDDASHAADSFRYLAMALRAPAMKTKPKLRIPGRSSPVAWMS